MTREVKLSLILGFAVVLAVGVLLSDHLSGARQARLDGLNPERGIDPVATAPIQNDEPTLILVDEQGRPEPRQPQVKPIPQNPAPRYAPVHPVRVADGTTAEPAMSETDSSLLQRLQSRMAQSVQGAVNDLASGETPPSAAQLATVDGVRFDMPQEDAAEESDQDFPTETATTAQHSVPQREASNGFRLYDVREGDTLWSIAARELGDGSRHRELSDLNRDRLGKGGVLRVGATLRLPSDGRAADSQTASARVPKQESAAEPSSTKKKNGRTVYTVKQGDTLSGLAAKFLGSSSKYEELLMANAGTLRDEDSLAVGMELNIPAR